MKVNFKDKEFNVDRRVILIGIIVLLVIAIILVSLNKQKKLECTVIRNNATANVEEKITASFKSGKLAKLVSYYKNEPTEDFQYMLDAIYDNYNGQLTELKDAGGYDYTIELGSDFVAFESTIDINTIPDETKNKVGFNNEWTYKDVKANLEDNEFKCK